MTTFWILIAFVVLIGLVLIWVPHFRQQRLLEAEEAGVRKQTNLELFNERLAILEKELAEDLLDSQEFEALKKELEISLLQDIKQGSDESLVNTVKPKGLLWPVVMSVTLLGISGYMYQHLGQYENLANPPRAANPHEGMTAEQIMSQRAQMMEMAVLAEPDNSQAWFNLGHAYISANRFDEAVNAFDKVIDLIGTHAELLGPKATALYYKNNQQMSAEIQALVDQSLALDPQDPSTLLLVGMDSFFTANYQKAIDAWQSILATERTDIDRTALMNAIETARMKIAAESGEMPQDSVHQPIATAEKTVTVQISVSPELAAKVSDSDMLFIFARTIEGPKVPLAATKISAKALPATITLDDSTNMGGDAKLSSAKQVEIIAVLSKHGSVKPQSGDLKGSLNGVAVGGESVHLVLDTLVQ